MVTVKELVDTMTEKCASSNTFASSPKRFANSLRYACKLNCDTKRCTCKSDFTEMILKSCSFKIFQRIEFREELWLLWQHSEK